MLLLKYRPGKFNSFLIAGISEKFFHFSIPAGCAKAIEKFEDMLTPPSALPSAGNGRLNQGYEYRERLDADADGQSLLAYLSRRHAH